jgi:hypothetical protein
VAARDKLRRQARGWLEAELAAWANFLDSGPTQIRATVLSALQHWKVDPDLAGVRDVDALAKLPEPERKQWAALWAEVDSLLSKGRTGISP